jgi:D-glycero-alpha-D-manno-heptose 1-phosphate guanylyltransferase
MKLPTAVILAGGLGTRLASVSDGIPKALMPIGSRPFLDYLLRYLSSAGTADVVLSVGHLADRIEDFAGTGGQWGIRIRYSREMEPLGTGGAVKFAVASIADERALVVNGDSFAPVPVDAMLHDHLASQAAISLATVSVPDTARYGAVEVDREGWITRFREKGTAGAGRINAGFYLIERRVLDSMPSGPSSLERDVLPKWVGRGLRSYAIEGPFVDIGTPEDYRRTAADPRILGHGTLRVTQ